MKSFGRKSMAMVLLCISTAVSGMHPVRAECTVPGNIPETAYTVESNTVSGGNMAESGNDAIGTDGGTVPGGDLAGLDSSGGRQEHGGADAGDDPGADAAGTGGQSGKDGEDGGEVISPYGKAVCSDDRLAQWDMGNSSGRYGEADAVAVPDGPYGPYSHEATADFIVTVPAVATLTEDAENGRVIGMIPVTVECLRPVGGLSLHVEEGSLAMQDRLSGRTLALEHWWEDLPWEGAGSGISSNLWLKGERLAGDWEGTVRLIFTCGE